MTDRVIVPTADRDAAVPARSPATPRLLAWVLGLALVTTAWPVSPLSESPAPPSRAAAVVAPLVDASPATSESRWTAPILLPEGTREVVGLGSTVVAITPDGVWPAWGLFDGTWTKLRGIPRGPSFGSHVGVARANGFSVVGVFSGRSVIYDYLSDGSFAGARTVRDVEAGAFAPVTGGLALFDSNQPTGRLVSTTVTDLTPPGTVAEAASGMGWLLVLTSDGSVHGMQEGFDAEWRRLGEGFSALRGAGVVVAVGENATVGIHTLRADGTLARMDRAPFGPTAVAGTAVSVHDWSSDSIWVSESGSAWKRLPLWADAGFDATFRKLVSGTALPTVVAGAADSGQELWTAAP